MKITNINNKRLILEYPTRKEMILSNFRISEFKEGVAGIKGRVFTCDEFIDAYSDAKGNIDYFSYWDGFNYSKKELTDFWIEFGPASLTERELTIWRAAKQIQDDGYIIAMVEGDEITLRHESAHGLWFENKEYKEKAKDIILSIPIDIYRKFEQHLKDMTYIQEVIQDEMQAYLVAWDKEEWKECFKSIKLKDIKYYRDKLNELYDKYIKENGN